MSKEWTDLDQKAYNFINKVEFFVGRSFSGVSRDELHYELVDLLQRVFEDGKKAGPGLPSIPPSEPAVRFYTKKTKPLAELTPADVPRGLTPEDVALDED